MFNDDDFQNARYIIDIGQNDLAGAFTHSSYAQVIERIPSFIAEIKYAIWVSLNFGHGSSVVTTPPCALG